MEPFDPPSNEDGAMMKSAAAIAQAGPGRSARSVLVFLLIDRQLVEKHHGLV
jgi:hypothetical protein